MFCKFCGAELPESETLCAACGKVTAAQEEAPEKEESVEPVQDEKKKRSPWKIGIAIGAAVVLLAALVAVIVAGTRGGFAPRENNIQYRDNYTVEDSKAAAKADEVIATVGDKSLTNGQLQVYYWMQVYDFLNYYGSYASMYGLDYTKPLNEQYYSEEDGTTWQQYFLRNAIEGWQNYAVLCILGEKAGFELDEEYTKFFEELPDTLQAAATENGFESVNDMFRADMGPGCDVDDYIEYMNLYYYGYLYFGDVYDSVIPTTAEIEAYYTENQEALEADGYGKDDGNSVDVRHILICVEGGTKDEDGNVTYSDDEWEACRAEAQALLDQWKSGEATEDSFAALANEKSEDTGSNTNGGLYQGVTSTTNFVEPFLNWCMDENRQVGDTDLVQSSYGYHIMYFSASEELWVSKCRDSIISAHCTKMLEDGIAEYPIEVDYKAIVLGNVDLVSES